ncbi:hypothetical protein GLOTRDRAFT_139761 [Gloeophyllum trabeum ATCC 11539]|uniref:Oxidoreductase-like domain-containing protein n=1 Tax=Gloeophyllum trabeum (strain ATCC 11539 / FP-39264 / Madison 617) TaxID=670483 RepID=S7RLM4_GLOTA|nr:uncharacterized protein GLOTRDRAFT_139761 [Gloeophyllum trabeum ATCC 11539]EPQ53574.1 hypothetical protein GLOTRDRAFT_139761 [Gloeophyllum trabeum ATCC 11539]
MFIISTALAIVNFLYAFLTTDVLADGTYPGETESVLREKDVGNLLDVFANALNTANKRLERSLREKASLTEFIGDLPGDTAVSSPPGREVHPVHRPSGTVKTFRGLVIPEEPKPPAADECCMSGCAVCVYDLYEESLQAYNASLNALRSTLRAWNVPESEWPASIRDAGDAAKESEGNKTKNVTLSAFEELEKMLQQKRAGT